jgi:putative ABC transport system permease protein
MILTRIFSDSFSQAFQQLWTNRLRTFLSLLGILIGIICIIGVLAAVDSLESNVRGSLDKLGDDVIYIQKISWAEDPGANYLKYLRRPSVDYEDFEVVRERVQSAEQVSYTVGIGSRTAKYRSNSLEGTGLFCATYDFFSLFKIELEEGRYFSPSEYHFGSNKVIIGTTVRDELFGPINPLGKTISVGGRKLEVVGVFEKSGNSLINVFDFDDNMMISYELGRKIANLKSNSFFGNSQINVKAREGVDKRQLKDEIISTLRAHRRLKPKQEDNFSLNELSILSNILDSFFWVLNIVGWVIGGFSIFVGMFSVANIMFVSVKERTSIIGVKKALGARQSVILLEFLIESIVLCLVGGIVGLVLVQFLVMILTQAIEFEFFLSVTNIILGITLSVVVGVLAGFFPALQAARMDPVVAMRK